MPIEKYLASLITPILSKPEALRINTTSDEMGVLLSITLAPEDMGQIIGRAGETAKSIRHIVRVVGVKGGQRVSIKINEPDGSVYRPKIVKTSDRELLDNK